MQFGRSKATPEKPKSRSKTTRLGCLIPLPMTLYRFAGEEGGWLGGRRGVTGKLGWGSESGHKRGGNRVFGHQKDPLYILPPPWLNCFPRLSLAERVKSFNDGKKSKGFGKITGYLGIRTPVTVTRLPQPCGSGPLPPPGGSRPPKPPYHCLPSYVCVYEPGTGKVRRGHITSIKFET